MSLRDEPLASWGAWADSVEVPDAPPLDVPSPAVNGSGASSGIVRETHIGAAPFSLSLEEFIQQERPTAEALILDTDGRPLIARRSLTLLGARGGAGKTTFFVDLALHLAAGVDYLCFKIPQPASVLLIENEGPQEMFQVKLEEKLRTFPHERKARIGVHVLDWGGFTLADPTTRDRLRADISAHGYEVVFGDPLDSLGMEGVGSPDDTRKFLERMKECGLNTTVAWWLNTHPRKEETKEALDEISGAWGGKPDAVLLLNQLADDRSYVRFPKLRWAKRGKRSPILLGFDPDTESFSYIGEHDDAERDYLIEVAALLGDGKWRTVKQVACKKEDGGVGASEQVIKDLLAAHPDKFEARTGEAAKEVGRHPSATVYRLASPRPPLDDAEPVSEFEQLCQDVEADFEWEGEPPA